MNLSSKFTYVSHSSSVVTVVTRDLVKPSVDLLCFSWKNIRMPVQFVLVAQHPSFKSMYKGILHFKLKTYVLHTG